MLTPYQFASNQPIVAVDVDGLEAQWVVQYGANFAIGAIAEASINYMFDPNVKTWDAAFKKVEYWKVAKESAIDLVASKKIRSALHGAGQMFDYVNLVGVDNVSTQGLVTSGLIGVLEPYLGDAVAKYGWQATKWGMRRLGVSWVQIQKIGGDLGMKYASVLPSKLAQGKGHELAEIAGAARVSGEFGSPSGGYNISVFKYFDVKTQEIKTITMGSDAAETKAMKEGYGHAEQRIMRFLEENGIDPGDVSEVYSELDFCPDCMSKAIKKLPNLDKAEYLFDRKIDIEQLKNYRDKAYERSKQNKSNKRP